MFFFITPNFFNMSINIFKIVEIFEISYGIKIKGQKEII